MHGPRTPRTDAVSWLLAPVALLAGVAGLAAAWAGVALLSNSHAGWMAVVAALDAVLMLRLVGIAPGRSRATLALLTTAVAIAAGNYVVLATWMGMRLGLQPLEAVLQLGPGMAWTFAGYANGAADLLWIAAGLVLAWWLAR